MRDSKTTILTAQVDTTIEMTWRDMEFTEAIQSLLSHKSVCCQTNLVCSVNAHKMAVFGDTTQSNFLPVSSRTTYLRRDKGDRIRVCCECAISFLLSPSERTSAWKASWNSCIYDKCPVSMFCKALCSSLRGWRARGNKPHVFPSLQSTILKVVRKLSHQRSKFSKRWKQSQGSQFWYFCSSVSGKQVLTKMMNNQQSSVQCSTLAAWRKALIKKDPSQTSLR